MLLQQAVSRQPVKPLRATSRQRAGLLHTVPKHLALHAHAAPRQPTELLHAVAQQPAAHMHVAPRKPAGDPRTVPRQRRRTHASRRGRKASAGGRRCHFAPQEGRRVRRGGTVQPGRRVAGAPGGVGGRR
ncbi:hypothetical protein GUJ93_ZPchr0683g2696 [Zizania palustris]|uniref:Uncharacterized protein n=1 Tax=Zizania palustris TaxID=103762 RepID=A0A8J5UUE3_ZIZPA|nr:hypothetical protein GUJ93_ZPchr0683g2696 [Zizania palustris]